MNEVLIDKACFERGCACYDSRESAELVKVFAKEITIEMKDRFGKMKYYPYCNDAKLFASIAGTSTMTEQTLKRIMKLGYKVKVAQRANELTEGDLK
jgi:hypothetical protein